MNYRPTHKNKPLQMIPESNSGEQNAKNTPFLATKRVSINSLMSSIQFSEPKYKEKAKQCQSHESKVEQKDRMIRQLQQQILQKKLKNDMIQEAFQRRNDNEKHLIKYTQTVEVLVSGCKLLAEQNPIFKKAYFRSLITILKNSGKNKQKAIKALLIWMIGWITRLFTFLSGTLIKK